MLLKFSNLATDKSTMVTLLHRATSLLLFVKTPLLEWNFISQIRALVQQTLANRGTANRSGLNC